MAEPSSLSITAHFAPVEDPRIERTKRHKLIDIIVIAICAVICGAEDWVAIERFGQAKIEWFQTFLELPNGIPSHDTFGRVFGLLNPEQFQNQAARRGDTAFSPGQANRSTILACRGCGSGRNWWAAN